MSFKLVISIFVFIGLIQFNKSASFNAENMIKASLAIVYAENNITEVIFHTSNNLTANANMVYVSVDSARKMVRESINSFNEEVSKSNKAAADSVISIFNCILAAKLNLTGIRMSDFLKCESLVQNGLLTVQIGEFVSQKKDLESYQRQCMANNSDSNEMLKCVLDKTRSLIQKVQDTKLQVLSNSTELTLASFDCIQNLFGEIDLLMDDTENAFDECVNNRIGGD